MLRKMKKRIKKMIEKVNLYDIKVVENLINFENVVSYEKILQERIER